MGRPPPASCDEVAPKIGAIGSGSPRPDTIVAILLWLSIWYYPAMVVTATARQAPDRHDRRAAPVRRRGRARRDHRNDVPRVDTPADARSRVTYRLEITGPAGDTLGPLVGPEISGDFPDVLAALVGEAAALDLIDNPLASWPVAKGGWKWASSW